MTLKDRLKASAQALFGRVPGGKPEMVVRSASYPINSPEAKALMAALKRGDTSAVLDAIKGMPSGIVEVDGAMAGDPRQAAMEVFGGDGAGNTLNWQSWVKERDILLADAPGWSHCRFYNRIGPTEARGVFGIVKGDFGIWRSPYFVCDHDDEHDEQQEGVILPALSHLGSGIGLGVFCDVATAALAASLCRNLPWDSLPVTQTEPDAACREAWMRQSVALKSMWSFHGITPQERRHAHDESGHYIQILAKTDAAMTEGKPEKAS